MHSDAVLFSGNGKGARCDCACSTSRTRAAYALCAAGRGNYWSAAAADGYDLDGDGVLDAPHDASSPLAELALNRENLRPLLNSPAARALGWAERTFPVFTTAGVVDSCPLAHAPPLAALSALPAAPAAQLGGTGPQRATSAFLLIGATAALVRSRVRRRSPRHR